MTEPDEITLKTHQWAANYLDIGREQIISVRFNAYRGGYCETCEYTTAGVRINYKDARGQATWDELEVDMPVVDIVREITSTEVKDT